MRRIIAQARKELTQIMRDRLALALALVLPVALLMLLSTAISLTVTGMPIIVQDLDDSPASRDFIDAFRASNTFHVVAWDSKRQPSEAFRTNAARGALIIPFHFGQDLARGLNTEVQMLVDASDANTAKLVQGYSGEIVAAWNAQNGGSAHPVAVTADVRLWFNPGRDSKKFYGPGIFVLGISMFPPLLATLASAKEGELKTILQVYVSNIPAHEFLLGKILAFMIIAVCEAVLELILLFTYFGLHFAGDPTPFFLATLLYAFCVASFGTLIGSAVPNQAAAIQAVALGGFLLVFLLSGLLFPVENIPSSIRWISGIVWGKYYIEIVRDALLTGGGWAAMWTKVMAIGVIGIFFRDGLAKNAEDATRYMSVLNYFLNPRLRALIGKEFSQIRRDRRLALSLVIPPVIQLVLFGFALNATVSHLKLGVVDDSGSVQSRDLIANMTQSGSFDLARTYGSSRELGDALSRGELDAGLIVPTDFEKDLQRGRPTEVQLLLNAMNANTAAIGQGYAEGVIQTWNQTIARGGLHAKFQRIAANPATIRGLVAIHPAFLFNPALITNWFTVTGTFGVLLMLNGSVISSASMIKERERGTVEQLLMTPATTSEIIIAKILPLFMLLCVLVLFAASLLKIIFDVPFRGNIFLVLSGGALCVLCGIGVGTFIATYTKSAQQAQLMAFFINPPLSSLSGSLTPVEAMPQWLQPITLLNPIRHFSIIVRSCLLKGSGMDTLWPNYLALIGFATVLLTLSVRRFRKQLG